MDLPKSFLSQFAADAGHTTQIFDARIRNTLQSAEMPQQFAATFGTDARDTFQRRFAAFFVAARGVTGDGEAVRLVADVLDQMQRRRIARQHKLIRRTSGTRQDQHLQPRLAICTLGDADDPDVREAIAANFTGMVDVIAGLIATAQARGLARKDIDPRIAAWHFMAIGFTFDLVHHLALDGELDRGRVEAWGHLFIDSLREAPHEPPKRTNTRAPRRALPVRQPGGEDLAGRGGDPLPPVPESAHDSLGTAYGGGADD